MSLRGPPPLQEEGLSPGAHCGTTILSEVRPSAKLPKGLPGRGTRGPRKGCVGVAETSSTGGTDRGPGSGAASARVSGPVATASGTSILQGEHMLVRERRKEEVSEAEGSRGAGPRRQPLESRRGGGRGPAVCPPSSAPWPESPSTLLVRRQAPVSQRRHRLRLRSQPLLVSLFLIFYIFSRR